MSKGGYMHGRGWFGNERPKIVVGFQHSLPDGTQVVKAYAGIVEDGSITIDYDTIPVSLGMYVTEIHTGRKRVHLDVVFDLHNMGATMKTWEDVKEPAAEIESPRKEIEQ